MGAVLSRWVNVLLLVVIVTATFLPSLAFAARPDDLSILLSDSRKSTVSNYTITHDQNSGAQFTSGDTLDVTFPAGFNLTALASPGDYDFKVASTDETVQTAACGATDTVRASVSSQVITFEACSSYTAEAAGSIIEIQSVPTLLAEPIKSRTMPQPLLTQLAQIRQMKTLKMR